MIVSRKPDVVELDLDFDAPARPPTLVAIVHPESGFIEQVPRAVAERAAAED